MSSFASLRSSKLTLTAVRQKRIRSRFGKRVNYNVQNNPFQVGGSMNTSIQFVQFVSVGAALFSLSGAAWAAAPPASSMQHHAATAESAKSAPTDEELIASAMKAAPKKVAE